MADKLTPQQAQAVYDRGGTLLVSAAAGSGKTKVLVDRLLCYLTDPNSPADLDEFLIITYTKAAASELRGKIAAKLTQRIAQEPENRHLQKQMQRLFLTKISTVHGFCGDLLREFAYQLDLPADFRVADENECREIRETVMQTLLDNAYAAAAEDEDFRAFVDTQGLGRDDRLVPQIVEKVYDSARCHLNPDQWLCNCLAAADVKDISDAAQTTWGRHLMEDLKEYLESQIAVLNRCAQDLECCPGMEKPAVNIRDTLYQLMRLRDADSWDAVHQNGSVDYGRLTFPRKNPDEELTQRVKAARNACKKGLEKKLHSFSDPSEQVLSDLRQSAAGTRGLIALVRQFERDYSAAKRSRRVLDFSDLEHKTLDLLLGKTRSSTTAAARDIGKRYREILVDEYQDSNGVQDAIFGALTEQKHNCFLVGDVKQSIYQFRLADPGIFLEKYHRFVPAEEAVPKQGRKVLLSHNFRSGGEVIEAVNDVFSACMTRQVGGLDYGEAEALREGIPHEPLPEPGVELHVVAVEEDTYAEESAYVANCVERMIRNGTLIRKEDGLKPVQPEDIVILLRSPGSIGARYQQALERRGIRCTSGGGMDLLQTEEIGTFRSFLQTIMNPRLDIPLVSTLASPIFGFSADDLAKLRSRQKKGSIYDALLISEEPKVQQFLSVLTQLRREARMGTLTQLLQKCIVLTRLDSVYSAMPGGEGRNANIQMFYQLAADYEKSNLRDLGQFLEHLDALESKGMLQTGASAAGSVTIMSIHKSKGLEFPVVFLCGLSREFNRESLRAQILCDKELGLGLSVADNHNRIRYPSLAKRAIAAKMTAESLSEEMRVLYVAMTRARDRLVMTYASRNPDKELGEIAMQLDLDGGRQLCRDVVCPGEWVLLTAMQHTEAGALHAIGGKPRQTKIGAFPWRICVSGVEEGTDAAEQSTDVGIGMPEDAPVRLEKALSFRYAHTQATQAPSKQTATGRKGRIKDAEAAENAPEQTAVFRDFRRPSFLSSQESGKEYGSAIHAAMQYLRYEECRDEDTIAQEIQRLVEEGFLREEQGKLVDCRKIAAFFATDIGRKLRSGTPCLREFKFSILDDGNHYGDGLEGEQVLLQGVVDCALLEEDGITVLDFKTDYVTADTVDAVVDRYRVQIQTYAQALSRIYEMPVKKQYLYLFGMNQFVQV